MPLMVVPLTVTIAEIKRFLDSIEVGGGIRTLERIRDFLAVGIDRIIIRI